MDSCYIVLKVEPRLSNLNDVQDFRKNLRLNSGRYIVLGHYDAFYRKYIYSQGSLKILIHRGVNLKGLDSMIFPVNG